MTKQITKIAALLILAIGLLTSAAAAQSNTNGDLAQNTSFTGIETARGTSEPVSNIFYGNTFVLNSFTESETQHFTLSLNYLCERCDRSSRLPVVGGSWSLVITRNNVYAGTLYGKVTGGTIDVITNRNGEPGFRQMQINLQTTGGLGRFAGRGSVNITGVYEAITDAVSNQTTGSVILNSRL